MTCSSRDWRSEVHENSMRRTASERLCTSGHLGPSSGQPDLRRPPRVQSITLNGQSMPVSSNASRQAVSTRCSVVEAIPKLSINFTRTVEVRAAKRETVVDEYVAVRHVQRRQRERDVFTKRLP